MIEKILSLMIISQTNFKTNDNEEQRTANNAYSLWRVNGYQQGFRSVASLCFGGQESASKQPQAICKTLCAT